MIKRFNELKNKYPNLSSLMCYIRAIKGRNYSADTIETNLKLVDWEDYRGSSRKELLAWLNTV